VISRGTAFTYKGKGIDSKALGKELGVRYVLQGSVRRSGDQVRVNASLTDLATGADVWSDRFDGDRSNLAALQDQITSRLARNLNVELIQAESRRGEIERPNNPDAVDLSMRGWSKLHEPRTQASVSRAVELFDNALRLDPRNIDPMSGRPEAWSCRDHCSGPPTRKRTSQRPMS
jgi:adenylate cyclase